MKISHAKVLITILFYIDTTFPETIEIIRTLSGPHRERVKWKNGVDSFHIPQSVCHRENSTYGNYCNMSCTIGETGNHGSYLCSCSRESSTVAYFENKWSCMKNEEVRELLGCEANTNLFAGEKEEDNLRTLDPVTNKRANNKETKLTNRRGSCTINASSSWYIGCLGKKVLLGLHTRRFLLQWRRQRNAYSIKVNNSIDPIFRGKVINLGITCEPPTPIAEGCLLFKLEGNFTCPVVASPKPIISSAINPRTLSTKNDDVSSFSQSGIIVGVSVSAAIVLFILTATLFICRRRRSREDTQTSTSDQSNKDTRTVSRNTKTNSASELEEPNGYETCKDPLTSIYASSYKIPQEQLLQGPFNQQTLSPEGNSHSEGAYASLNIPEEHHIYGLGNVQEPVYFLQDPEIMFEKYGSAINQPTYYALEDLPVKDSVESVTNGPTDPEPVHNVLEDPKVMFHDYDSCIDQPLYYTLEDVSVNDSVENVNSGPTDPEPGHKVLEDPEVMFQNYGSGTDQPVCYALEDPSVENSVESVDNGPTEPEPVYNVLEEPCTESAEEPRCHGPVTVEGPVYNTSEEPNHYAGDPCKTQPVYKVLEAPGLSGTKTSDGYDPEHIVLEGPEPDESSEVGCLVLKISEIQVFNTKRT